MSTDSTPPPPPPPFSSNSLLRRGLLTPQPSFAGGSSTFEGVIPSQRLKRKRSSEDTGEGTTERAQARQKRLEEISKALEGILSVNRTVQFEPQHPARDTSSYLVWLDLETTGLVPVDKIRILEIAVRITDGNYVPLDDGLSLLIHWPDARLFSDLERIMSPNVQVMHKVSKLNRQYDETPIEDREALAQVEMRVCKYLASHGLSPRCNAIMAGAGVAFDRNLIEKQRHHMTELDKFFHYQVFDTTTLWHFLKRKYNRQQRFKDSAPHRALEDINGAIREARSYAELVLKDPFEVAWPSPHGL